MIQTIRIVPVTSLYRVIPRMTSEAARVCHQPRRDVMAAIPNADWQTHHGRTTSREKKQATLHERHFGLLLYKQKARRARAGCTQSYIGNI